MSRTKFTCGSVTPSGCVIYTGDIPSFGDEDKLACDPTIDEVFKEHATEITSILSQIDLTALNKRCLDFDPATVSVHSLFQTQIDKVCSLDTSVSALQTAINTLSIGSKQIIIDLKCIKPTTNPCGLDTNTYTLYAILNILVSEICNIKSQLT